MKKVLIFLLIAAGLTVAWFWFRPHVAAATEDEISPTASVETAELKKQVISQTLEVFGVVTPAPSSEQAISAAFDCIIRKVTATAGTRFATGDVLLEIEPSPEAKLLLDSSRTALDIASQTLTATQQRYDLKLTNSQDLLTARHAEQDARLKLASLEARGLGGATKIIAPSAGIVSKLELPAGALAVAGSALIIIAVEEHLEARLGLEAADLGRVSAGQPVSLVSVNRSDAKPVVSSVRVAGGLIDAITGAAEVRVSVPAGAPLLLGERVKASIELTKKETLTAPRRAVLPDEDKFVLFTVKAGKAVRHVVTPGITSGDLIEVSGPDLHDGDVVVTLGNYELTDGMAVQSKEKDAAGKTGEESKGVREAKP